MRIRVATVVANVIAAMLLLAPLSALADTLLRRELPSKDAKAKRLRFSGPDLVLDVTTTREEDVQFQVRLHGRRVDLPSPASFADNVCQVVRYGNALIVEGTEGDYSSFANITIIDLKRMSVRCTFSGYSASLSPDHSRLVFVRFFPLHFAEDTEDQAVVVPIDDVLTAGCQRARDSSDDPFFLPEAGRQILTLRGETRGRDNVLVPPNEAHHILSDFSWSPDSRVVGFLDQVGEQAPYLVTASWVSGRIEVKRYRFAFTRPLDRTWAIEWTAPSTPRLVRVQRGVQGMVTRQVVELGAPELVPQ